MDVLREKEHKKEKQKRDGDRKKQEDNGKEATEYTTWLTQ
jgi:hypothetical protein